MELETWSQSLFDGTSPGAGILASGYGVPGCDLFAGDAEIITALLEFAAQTEQPQKKRVSRRRPKALIRPRVPKDRVVLVTSMREANRIEWTLPRLRKIHSSENAVNIAKKVRAEEALKKAGYFEEAMVNRQPEPFKYDFILPDAELESRLKRRAVDFYNKQQFRWNLQEVRRLEEFAAEHGIDIK